MPEGALGKHHPIGKDGSFLVDPVRIALLVAAGRVADIEVALLVQGGRNRAAAEPGDAGRLDGEPLRQGKPMGSDALLAGGRRRSQQEESHEEYFVERAHGACEPRNSSLSEGVNEPTSTGYRRKPFSCLHL